MRPVCLLPGWRDPGNTQCPTSFDGTHHSAWALSSPLLRRPGLQLVLSGVEGFTLRIEGPRRKPPQNNSSPNPFLPPTHAPVISTGMNVSSRFSLRGWPTLSFRVSSGMACLPQEAFVKGGFALPLVRHPDRNGLLSLSFPPRERRPWSRGIVATHKVQLRSMGAATTPPPLQRLDEVSRIRMLSVTPKPINSQLIWTKSPPGLQVRKLITSYLDNTKN